LLFRLERIEFDPDGTIRRALECGDSSPFSFSSDVAKRMAPADQRPSEIHIDPGTPGSHSQIVP
jgi:hypothetical protein